MRYVLATLGGLFAILALTWIFQGNDFFLMKVFAPREEAVRRQVFEESKAYNEGMAQELRAAQRDYQRATTPEQKAGIASYVAHMAAGYDSSKLPPDLRGFVDSCEGGSL